MAPTGRHRGEPGRRGLLSWRGCERALRIDRNEAQAACDATFSKSRPTGAFPWGRASGRRLLRTRVDRSPRLLSTSAPGFPYLDWTAKAASRLAHVQHSRHGRPAS